MTDLQQLVKESLRLQPLVPGSSPIKALLERTDLPEDVLLETIAQISSQRFLYPAQLESLTPAFDILPVQECLKRELLPLNDEQGELVIALADPYQPLLQDWLSERLHPRIYKLALATRGSLHTCMATWGENNRLAQNLSEAGTDTSLAPALTVTVDSLREEHPAVRGLNAILLDAMNSQASDLHLENGSNALLVRLRLDGVLITVNTFNGRSLADQIVSRIKVLAELDISERRIPQDGRFRAIINQRDVDIRVSIMPGLFGEDAVLRILDRKHLTGEAAGLTLEHLGFDEQARHQLRRIARQPYGMLLVTGPTGSGKTTTLYSLLSEVRTGEEKIITVEDPVEYQLDGVLQIPVNEAKGLTFARGLRSILRHDPDTIMVGEIRDAETAAISIQAALTGHTVFTSVHANGILDVIQRFRHMGVDAYAMTSALNGIVAQRLLRRICPHCAHPWQPDEGFLHQAGLSRRVTAGQQFSLGKGCAHCRGTGYKGRMAIAEFMQLDDGIRDLIVAQAPISQLKTEVRQRGTLFLREAALNCALQGQTTLQEVVRVTFAD